MKVKYTGKSVQILNIMQALNKTSCVRVFGNSITLPTEKGAKAFYKGDTIIIENGLARLESEVAK